GFGHGVGVSQWGANALAKQGKSPEQIITYYFKDVDIVKLWE
ncbi:MAG: stage II sporulation protein SpoIID, partial [Thermoanaerobacterales bacterium]|nr:stage II sporulation protein SpoIID [Thermoanaerobacterales bacterium]